MNEAYNGPPSLTYLPFVSETSTKKVIMSAPKKIRYLDDLGSGLNFQIIQGKQESSKLIVIGDHAYVTDKAHPESPGVFYIKCKFHRTENCRVRGKIDGNFATLFNLETVGHSCSGQSSSMRWKAEEARTRMKERAASETSSLDVSCAV